MGRIKVRVSKPGLFPYFLSITIADKEVICVDTGQTMVENYNT
jgi:hypothetical protein